jgi:hypothetical protein
VDRKLVVSAPVPGPVGEGSGEATRREEVLEALTDVEAFSGVARLSVYGFLRDAAGAESME